MITSHRVSLNPDVVEATQCSKDWLKSGVITPQILTSIGAEGEASDAEDLITIDQIYKTPIYCPKLPLESPF